jgi:hypothetical protein
MKNKSEKLTLLSGEHSRRRGYLVNIITALNGLAVTGTLAIWSTTIKWELLYTHPPNYIEFTTRLAWASGLSSFLLGLWRFYVHFLDSSIIRLYPAIYLLELGILPAEVASIKPPKLPENVIQLTNVNLPEKIKWYEVENRDFGGRGHQFIDILVGLFIIASSVISLWVPHNLSIISFVGAKFHLIGWLMFGNIAGILFVIVGWRKWEKKKVNWPILDLTQSNNSEAQPVA